MCLAIPGKVIEIDSANVMRMSSVDFGGITREISLAYLPEVQVNDYVIVHAGFAISQLDEEEAHETLRLLAELGAVEQELNAAAEGET
ncbi:MAG: HypC/HybG/HupF family hydrogenase formation chaperone [Anaerolineae bacterium]|nr:HypC/HybG/HupF family hydrogenase formation chaperone [Anaerolineae bacterium]